MVCVLHLANGWTASISEDDTPPAICSVAAWPSSQDELPWREQAWFDFANGRTDRRCWTLEDVREALTTVEAAECRPERTSMILEGPA